MGPADLKTHKTALTAIAYLRYRRPIVVVAGFRLLMRLSLRSSGFKSMIAMGVSVDSIQA